MPEFNYLIHNESDFPHLRNVDVYKFDNDFDYGRFDYDQMELQICTVPWDMGEAHIGNRTISGIGNVVYFESKEERDKWFDAIPDLECYRFKTKFKELHRSLQIDVPVPYDMCAKHNYLVVKYAKFANENSPVQYEGSFGLREWFWFIREVEFLAPNTTRLHLMDDAFQTWIYDINVSGMMLERGHAPMFAIKADSYLGNPLTHNEYLLTEDVNFGEARIVQDIQAVALNAGNMYACIATSANPQGTWGSKSNNDWKVPTSAYYNQQGQPSMYVFCMKADKLNDFLSNISSSYPQFRQTVQGVWFASDDLITLGDSFTFASTTCYRVKATRQTLDFFELEKAQFGYPQRYANIAKLYTSPYAHIELTDENGNVDIIKIEDTTGTFKINAAMNTAYPFITVDAQLTGVGGTASKTITFKNITDRSITLKGQWYETLHSWNVPVFAIVLNPGKEYDYSTHFDRKQRVVDYTAAKDNADASADTLTANAGLQATANSANASAHKTLNSSKTTIDNSTVDFQTNHSLDQLLGSVNNQIDAAEQTSAIAAATTAVTAGTSAISNLASGNIGGAVTAAIGGAANAASTMAQCAVGTNLMYSDAEVSADFTTATADRAQYANNAHTTAANANIDSVTSANNALVTGSAANSAATEKANALRNKNAAASAVSNDVLQADLRAPFIYGSFENGDTSTTRPMAMIAHIVTQSKSAIASAGDEFVRYGYMFEKFWEFNGNWNIGKYFTYWKLKDFWVSNLDVPDMYMDKIRFFLFGGVTVWRKPEYIGKIDPYTNFDV
ncbi:MAG: hypothetical protein IK117_12415 [Bacteroidales bacterium]|nr:hypothetical protein [Bacteroidales bacterium]